MQRRFAAPYAFLLLAVGLLISLVLIANDDSRDTSVLASAQGVTNGGALQIVDGSGQVRDVCPLRRTNVEADITGFLSRVTVTQEFENPSREAVEAVYTFPLPQAAAVDDMTMRIGERTVRGRILRREEAQAVYNQARRAGQVAGLLDQERPNIFTQRVANIMPGENVTVTISYVETLKYEDGEYEFSFPMVVGPRYIPGTSDTNGANNNQAAVSSNHNSNTNDEQANPSGANLNGRVPPTDQVPDAPRITPPVTPPGMRAGHDISLSVSIDAGVPLGDVRSGSHEIEMGRTEGNRARVQLRNLRTIPNRDFVLRYDVAGNAISDAVLAHRSPTDARGGFFTLILQPPDEPRIEDVTPKEIVFVLDTSGSMFGFPIEKAKEAMSLALDGLNPQDTFNLITFAGDTSILFPEPVPATRENLLRAQMFLNTRQGGGGTEMMRAIRAALDPSDAQDHVRVVCFMTDGYVGNDMEILAEIGRHPNARIFSFGIGGSVNRFLLDRMAEAGRGEVEYVALNDDGSAAARRFHERVRSPLLTDISIDWGGLPVTDIYPRRIPDLFSAKPLILTGRYTGAGGRGMIRLRGRIQGREVVREIPVELPASQSEHDVLATLWARRRIDDLMSQDYGGIQRGTAREDVQQTITQLGLEYRLMTQFTSFVAVEERIVNEGGVQRRVEVPVEMPSGVSYEGVFGRADQTTDSAGVMTNAQSTANAMTMNSNMSVSPSPSAPPLPAPNQPVQRRMARPRAARMSGGAMSSGVAMSDTRGQSRFPKLDPALAAVVERLRNRNAGASTNDARFVRDGRATIQILLTQKTASALAALRRLGFEVTLNPADSRVIVGRLPLERLEQLAALDFVQYIAPETGGN